MQVTWIENAHSFRAFYKRISNQNRIGIDTEFMRQNTYWPKLCLMQIASDHEVALLDMLILGQASELIQLLTDPSMLKIFHSLPQDLEAISYHLNCIPFPVFDIQIGALFCNFNQLISYQTLVKTYLNIKLDKKACISDWSKRPLSQAQYDYAANDAKYLVPIYVKMQLQLGPKYEWACSAGTELIEAFQSSVELFPTHLPLKGTAYQNGCRLYMAREHMAQTLNLPKKWVLPDLLLAELAKKMPNTASEIDAIQKRIHVKCHVTTEQLLNLCQQAKALTLPDAQKPVRAPSPPVFILHILTLLLDHVAVQHQIAPFIIATTKELSHFIMKIYSDKMLYGWRYEIFWKNALKLIDGTLSIHLCNEKLVFTHIT